MFSAAGFLQGSHFSRFRGNSLTKTHLAFIYFIYEAPKAKWLEKSAERETGNVDKKKRRDKNTEQSHDGSG